MRGKKMAINTMFSFVQEFISIVCSFILPRLILSVFGSRFNGLITSITQFLSCAVLLRSGLGGATRAALYKPLANQDSNAISAIVNATERYMRRIGILLAALIFVFAGIYPFLVQTDFDWFFSFSLVLIIGASTFAESFFGITYLIVLQADQKLWVTSLLSSICSILNTVIASILMLAGASIHMVKLGSAFVFVMYPIVIGLYVRKKYSIDRTVPPNNSAISQRWDAFWHQVSFFVMNNTGVMVLTIFSNLAEVSVYGIYNMVFRGLKRIVMAFSGSQEAAYGNMIAKNQIKELRENVGIMETLMFGISTIIYSCAVVLVLDFVQIYTLNIHDIDYYRPFFAYVMIVAQLFNGFRLPYQTVVQAAGHYKQTKIGAIIEPILNIVVSVIFVFKYGLIGVAIGACIATIFRTIQYSFHMSKTIINRNWSVSLLKILISFGEMAVILLIMKVLPILAPVNYAQWIVKAVISFFISASVVCITSCILFRNEFFLIIKKIKMIFIK